jgi:hypothetical protein
VYIRRIGMAFQSNPNKHPDYDPIAVATMINKGTGKKKRLLKLIREYKTIKDAGAGAIILKKIKLLLATL